MVIECKVRGRSVRCLQASVKFCFTDDGNKDTPNRANDFGWDLVIYFKSSITLWTSELLHILCLALKHNDVHL